MFVYTNSEDFLENSDGDQRLFSNNKEIFNTISKALCHTEVAFNFQNT